MRLPLPGIMAWQVGLPVPRQEKYAGPIPIMRRLVGRHGKLCWRGHATGR